MATAVRHASAPVVEQQLREAIYAAHNYENRLQRTVWILYGTGEITSQPGGEDFERRAEHVLVSAVAEDSIVRDMPDRGHSAGRAFLTDQKTAWRLREMIKVYYQHLRK